MTELAKWRTDKGALVILRVLRSQSALGRLCECPCGWTGWTGFGKARDHALACPAAGGTNHVAAWESLRGSLDPLEAERAVRTPELSA